MRDSLAKLQFTTETTKLKFTTEVLTFLSRCASCSDMLRAHSHSKIAIKVLRVASTGNIDDPETGRLRTVCLVVSCPIPS